MEIYSLIIANIESYEVESASVDMYENNIVNEDSNGDFVFNVWYVANNIHL